MAPSESLEISTPEIAEGELPNATVRPLQQSTTNSHKVAPVSESFIEPDLSFILERLTRHATLVNAVFDLSVASGLVRLRACAVLVLNEVREHNYRKTWLALRRRRDIRKKFVSAYALKMVYDDALAFWEMSDIEPGATKAEQLYQSLLKEVPSYDNAYWTSLAKLERRLIIAHM